MSARVEAGGVYAGQQVVYGRGRADIYQRQPGGAGEQVAGDDAFLATEERVDLPEVIGQLVRQAFADCHGWGCFLCVSCQRLNAHPHDVPSRAGQRLNARLEGVSPRRPAKPDSDEVRSPG